MWEAVTLTMLGSSSGTLTNLLNQARDSAMALQEGHTVLYTSFGHEWRPFGAPRRKRPFSSVILHSGQGKTLQDDASEFMRSASFVILFLLEISIIPQFPLHVWSMKILPFLSLSHIRQMVR